MLVISAESGLGDDYIMDSVGLAQFGDEGMKLNVSRNLRFGAKPTEDFRCVVW